jgi:hypothetical protein
VEQITGIHEAQLLTYMKLARVAPGLLVNFFVLFVVKEFLTIPQTPQVTR